MMKNKMVRWVLAVCMIAGCLFRGLELFARSLEYDEIWTQMHYFKCSFIEIFFRLETPNNHPLHTLLAKYCYNLFGGGFWALRFTAMFSGVALLVLAFWAAVKYFRSKYAQIAIAVLIAFSPYLVHYSNTARGYSMQAFFVFAMMLFLFSYAQKPSILKACGVFAAAVAALFTIYSGLIFVCAAGGAYLLSFFKWRDLKNEFKKNLFLFAAGVDFLIVTGLWLGLNWGKITQAQQFGTKIISCGQFFQSAGHLSYELGLLLPLILLVFAFVLRPGDRVLRFGLIFWALVMLSMLATKCGPERVYMPMIAVVFFCAVRGIEIVGAFFRKIRYTELVLTIILCLPCIFVQSGIERISSPDWQYFVKQMERNTPEDCYIVYPAGDTYPIYFNYPDSAMNLAELSKKILSSAGFVSMEKQKISCLSEDNSEQKLSLGKPFANHTLSNNYSMSMYTLMPLTERNFCKGKPLIAFFVSMPKRRYFAMRKKLFDGDDCYLLNAFFNRDYIEDYTGAAVRSIPFFIPETSHDFAYYAELATPELKFYILNYPE